MDDQIITFTAAAIQHAKAAVDTAREQDPDAVLRIGVQGGGCAGLNYRMTVELPQDGDLPLEAGDLPAVVAADAVRDLKGTVIDYLSSPLASGFQFENPNAVASCGCGTSFRTDGDGCSVTESAL